MSDLNLTSFNPLYPMRVHQYDELFNDQNQGVPDKINSIIDYLNKVGKLTNDVVKDWNTVYQWVMNDGLTTDVNNKLEAMLANHEFDSIIDALATKVGDLNTLTTTAKDTIVNAINSLQTAVTANTANITTNTTNITTNTANIATNKTSLGDIAYSTKSFPRLTGETDDTARLQRAINQATTDGKRLAIAEVMTIGTVNITCELIGLAGHQITIKSGGALILQSLTQKIDGLNIICNSAQTFHTTGSTKYTSISIKNCTVNMSTTDTGIYGVTLWFWGSTISRIALKDNYITGGAGIIIISADECLIQGNIIDHQYKNTGESCQVSTKSVVRILDNTFYNSNEDVIDLYSSGYETIVRGNKAFGIVSSSHGAALMECKVIVRDAGSPNPGSNDAGFVRNTIIEGNIFKDVVWQTNGTFSGIYAEYLDQRTGTATWDASQTNEGMIIKNNIIENINFVNGLTSVATWGIDFSGINGIIDGNIIKDIYTTPNTWGTCGINLGGTYQKAIGTQIINNLIVTNSVGIQVQQAETCKIMGNVIRKNEHNSNLVARYGIRVMNELFESIISNNVIHVVDYPFDFPSPAIVTNCIFTNNHLKATDATTGGSIVCNTNYQYNNFNNNFMRNVTLIFQPTTLMNGNSFDSNIFDLEDFTGYGILLDYQNGLKVRGNTFKNTTTAIRLFAGVQNAILDDNIAINQSGSSVVNNGATTNIIQANNFKC